MSTIKLEAQKREEHGRGASRRLRRSGSVPAIIYGLANDATPISLDHNVIYHALKRENFHTSILSISLGSKAEKVLLRDFQMHAFRPEVLHLDFQRVNEKEEIQIHIPLHFINEETCHAVKVQGAHITRIATDVEIRALAKDLPNHIEVDLQTITAGQSIHLSNLVLPKGVTSVNLLRGEDSVLVIAAGISEEKEADLDVVSVADIPTIAGEKKSEE